MSPHAVLVAALGWLLICGTFAARFGYWLFPAGLGLGLLLAGAAVLLKDALASLIVAYCAAAAEAEGSAKAPHP